MGQNILFGVVGGLGMFLFGMRLLSDGLQLVASRKLKQIILMFTNKPVVGIMSGCLLTALIQSSSATTVMTIGFVNSGIMLLRQAIGVVIGANIGTTVTAQIIAFKISKYALPAIGIGAVLYLFSKSKKNQSWGQVILGFGILFLGLTTMGAVLKPLKDSEAAKSFFINLGSNPFLGIMIGTAVTVIVQSSSASIGLVIALASNGLIDFQAAVYLILGDNIGTTITAWLASIGTNISSKRVALAHSMFNLIGAAYFAILTKSGLFIPFVDYITPGPITTETIARNIANAHTLFNVANAIVFLPFIGLMEKMVKFMIKGEEEISTDPRYLEKHLLDSPEIAISQSKKEILRMLKLSKVAVKKASDGFFNRDRKMLKEVIKHEEAIDSLQSDITSYLVEVSKSNLTVEQSEQLPPLLHSVNDIEKIGDHAENIMRVAQRSIDEKMKFSEQGLVRIQKMYKNVNEMFGILIEAFENDAPAMVKNLFKVEAKLNTLYKDMNKEQIFYIQQGKDYVMPGLVFLDLLNNFEKIGDHLTNVAEAVTSHFRYQTEYIKPATNE